jgi:hypothetical protein
MKCKILFESKHANGSEYFGTKIISMNDKTFKIVYECRNGRSSLDVDIMNSDGAFVHLLSKFTLGFNHSARYVSDGHTKDKDFDKGFELCKEVIGKIYDK